MTSSGCQSTPQQRGDASDRLRRNVESASTEEVKPPIRRAGAQNLAPILDEVEMHVASGDPYLAHVLLRSLELEEADESSAGRAARLRVESSIALGLIDESLAWLSNPTLDVTEASRLRAQLCEARKDYACVFQQLTKSGLADADQATLNDRIWHALVTASQEQELQALAEGSADNHTAVGWIALLRLVRSATDLASERAAWSDWKSLFPDHPAANLLPDALRYLEAGTGAQEQHVAVLLPLSGQLQPIGRAVRDGIVSAHIFESASLPEGGQLPSLRFYDAATAPINGLVGQALRDGATSIVGPILREGVSAVQANPPGIPVIALNYAGNNAPTNTESFFQMGIAIEDEAREIGELLRGKSYQRPLFVVARTGWADRAMKQIGSTGEHQPIVLRVQNAGELTGLVGGALVSTPEFIRKSRVQTITGLPAIISPGKQHDIDAVVAFTDPVQTSTLGPALSYHSFGRIDTYMGTQSFRSANDVAGLGPVTVSDLPVMFAQDGFNLALRRAWLGQSAADISFFALGADAYRFLRRLPTSQSGSTRTIWGASGLLLLGEDRIVRRVQPFGTFRNGALRPLISAQ
jgi:outer membrane PBP1 activator LpoA protein